MKPEPTTVVLSVELDEEIYGCMQDFLASNPGWNQRLVINASMSLFFLQNHQHIKPKDYQACSQNYVHSVCALFSGNYSPTRSPI